jgi:hypothetical protein
MYKKIIDNLIYEYLKNNLQSLSSFDNNYFKNVYDWKINKEKEDLFIVNWGENLHGTNHCIIETGFFSEAIHIDRYGLYPFASFNLESARKYIESYIPKVTAKQLFEEGKLQSKFKQPVIKEKWDGVVLMCQHPTDRSILKAGTTKQYYEFVEEACKYYGKKLLLKVHPVNSNEIVETVKSIAMKYDSTVDKVGIDIIKTCEYVVLYNSTVVVDCLLREVPVLQYAPGYFWKTGTVDFSDRKFRTPIKTDTEYNYKFCDFLAWKYCFHMHSPINIWNKIFDCYANATELFPLSEKYSYAQYVIDKSLPDHLGGHQNITHIDEGILKFFIEKFNTKTFLDIGCGIGGQVELAKKLNMDAYGVDGDFTIKRSFPCVLNDFTKSECTLPLENFDLGWSVEFVEHVEEKYIHNYLTAFSKCKYLVITHAPPNKFGHHHVNCKPSQYWIDLLGKYGLIYSRELTDQIKTVSTMKREFIKQNGLVFINSK